MYLALAPKSVALYEGYKRAAQTVREQPNYPVPLHLRNAPTKLLASLGWGQGYQYNPHCPDGAPDQTYLPKELLVTPLAPVAHPSSSHAPPPSLEGRCAAQIIPCERSRRPRDLLANG